MGGTCEGELAGSEQARGSTEKTGGSSGVSHTQLGRVFEGVAFVTTPQKHPPTHTPLCALLLDESRGSSHRVVGGVGLLMVAAAQRLSLRSIHLCMRGGIASALG